MTPHPAHVIAHAQHADQWTPPDLVDHAIGARADATPVVDGVLRHPDPWPPLPAWLIAAAHDYDHGRHYGTLLGFMAAAWTAALGTIAGIGPETAATQPVAAQETPGEGQDTPRTAEGTQDGQA